MAAKPATAVARSSRDNSGSPCAVLRLREKGIVANRLQSIDHRRRTAFAASISRRPGGTSGSRAPAMTPSRRCRAPSTAAMQARAAGLRNREVSLEHAVAEVTAREHDLGCGNLALLPEQRASFASRRAAAHRPDLRMGATAL